MNSINEIQLKLQQFINKYYLNELLKGMLLFCAIGLLYFIFTLLIEHFLWLQPGARTILFWVFIGVEMLLFINYILISIIKLVGLRSGISTKEAAKIIGNHFLEVSDKLLNLIQLKELSQDSDLVLASIDQKAKQLVPIPFKRAIDFSKNKKYIPYAAVPILFLVGAYVSGNQFVVDDSLNRIVHFKTAFEAPAPFSFIVENKVLSVKEGDDFTLNVGIKGSVIPENPLIIVDGEPFYLESESSGKFKYTFSKLKKAVSFHFVDGKVRSKSYEIELKTVPVIEELKMGVDYPNYTNIKNEIIVNSGNLSVPVGTKITWIVSTVKTESLQFISDIGHSQPFQIENENHFRLMHTCMKDFNYSIGTTNRNFKNYEVLDFKIHVINDEFPKIQMESNLDSIRNEPVLFVGQVSDDYGISKVNFIYYTINKPSIISTVSVSVQKGSIADVAFVVPENLKLKEGENYEMYFEVFDNDGIQGAKKSKSKIFSFYKMTKDEKDIAMLKDQKNQIDEMSKSLDRFKRSNKEEEAFKNALKTKENYNWEDLKKLEDNLNRHKKYEELFKELGEQFKSTVQKDFENEKLNTDSKEIEKRISENQELMQQNKLLDELKKLAEKIDNEGMMQKMDDLVQKNKRNEKSLERILELTKRFYVEQKMNKASEDLLKLSDEQLKIADNPVKENQSKSQESINNKFNEIEKGLEELHKENEKLKRPMDIPEVKDDAEEVKKELENLPNELKQPNSKANTKQKSAARKMKELGKKLEKNMLEGESEMMDENIEDLRIIVENLIEFSFKQEDLMKKYQSSKGNRIEFSRNLKEQNLLKEYFTHIDDSLYVLSLRLVKMSTAIQTEVENTHYYLDQSISNFSESLFPQGFADQQFVITGANNLANSLSNVLESLLNASMGMGKGKGNSDDFSLPDIIKKQGDLMKEAQKGLDKSGQKPGEKGKEKRGGENGDQDGDSLYEIYKQQEILKNALQELLNKNGEGYSKGNASLKSMEDLQVELLKKGFTKELIKKMSDIQYQLLKLDEASFEQGEDQKRKATKGEDNFQMTNQLKLKHERLFKNYYEILNRQSLPLRPIFKEKVQNYFKKEE